MKKQSNNLRSVVIIACGAFILLIPVLLNGFPFIFPDSGDYLVFTPRIYHTPYYGLFIFFFHLNRWIWGPVLAQAVIVSHLLWVLLRLHNVRRIESAMIVMALLLTIFSSLPFTIGFIIPDIFTPIMFITMYIIGFHFFELPRSLKVYFILLACVATAAHVSNLTLAIGFFGLIAVLLPLYVQARAKIFRRLGLLAIPIGLTAAAILLFNTIIFGTFSLGPAGCIYFMANLIQYGPARTYLEESCPGAGYKICAYANQLPATADEFLWTTGMFQKLGGDAGMKVEARQIVLGTIKHDPTGVAGMIAKNFLTGLMAHEPGEEFRPAYQIAPTNDVIKLKFGSSTFAAYLDSAEMRNTIPHALIRDVDSVVVPAAFFALTGLGLLALSRGNRRDAIFAALILFAVLENTLLCASISGIHDRYQARVTWLLPMAVFIIGCTYMEKQKKRKKTWPKKIR